MCRYRMRTSDISVGRCMAIVVQRFCLRIYLVIVCIKLENAEFLFDQSKCTQYESKCNIGLKLSYQIDVRHNSTADINGCDSVVESNGKKATEYDCAIKICPTRMTSMSQHTGAHTSRYAHDMQEKIDQKISQIFDVKIFLSRNFNDFYCGHIIKYTCRPKLMRRAAIQGQFSFYKFSYLSQAINLEWILFLNYIFSDGNGVRLD